MKSASLLVLCSSVACGVLLTETGYAIEPFKKEFESKYVKKDPSTDAEKAFAEAVSKAKCNVCHVGKTKKERNEYGKALDALLDRKTDAKNIAKIQEALDQVAGQNVARDRMSPSCPSTSIQKPWANMSQSAAAVITQQDPSIILRPPMRSA